MKKEQQPFNLQNSILEWENHLIPTKYDCPKCKTLTVLPIIKKILNLSDILIIAIINKDKIIIDFKSIIRTSNFEYKLLSFINENGNNFDVIYYSETKFYTINNDNKLEEINDNQVNLNPNILFYEKVNTIEPTNINNKNNNNININNSEFNNNIIFNINNNIINNYNSGNNNQNNNDIQNMNNQNNYGNQNIINNEENDKEIALIFELSESGKVLYLDTKESFSFKNIIEELEKKYLWLKDVEISDYIFNRKIISVKEFGLIMIQL